MQMSNMSGVDVQGFGNKLFIYMKRGGGLKKAGREEEETEKVRENMVTED